MNHTTPNVQYLNALHQKEINYTRYTKPTLTPWYPMTPATHTNIKNRYQILCNQIPKIQCSKIKIILYYKDTLHNKYHMKGQQKAHIHKNKSKIQMLTQTTRKWNGPHSHTLGKKKNNKLIVRHSTKTALWNNPWIDKYSGSGIYQVNRLPPIQMHRTNRHNISHQTQGNVQVNRNSSSSGYYTQILNREHRYGK
jgi:hypothetical protein